MTPPRVPSSLQPRRARQSSLRVHIWNREAFPWSAEALEPARGDELVDRTGSGYYTPRRYEEPEEPEEEEQKDPEKDQ